MIIMSDVTTLQQRGKYNGFIGASCGVWERSGSAHWRCDHGACFVEMDVSLHLVQCSKNVVALMIWFYVSSGTMSLGLLLLITLLYITLPDGPVGGNTRSRIKMVDWVGLFISVTAVVLLVVRTALLKPASFCFDILITALRFLYPGVAPPSHGAVQAQAIAHAGVGSIRYIHLPNCRVEICLPSPSCRVRALIPFLYPYIHIHAPARHSLPSIQCISSPPTSPATSCSSKMSSSASSSGATYSICLSISRTCGATRPPWPAPLSCPWLAPKASGPWCPGS